MRRIKRGLSKGILLLLLPAVIWLFVNATVNRHYHYLSKYNIVSHAHPYHKNPADTDPAGSHQHSGSELLLLSLVSDPDTTASIIFLLVLFLLAVMLMSIPFYDVVVPIRRLHQVHNYHAPPVQLIPTS
jgi:4-amino-4-deoxy-L-arabinose transferase-like glycosyltransferase